MIYSKHNITILSSSIVTLFLFVLITNSFHNVSAHQKQLFSAGGKDYLLVVGNANEPVFLDDKSGVEMFAYIPLNKTDPLNTDPNSTKPIQGLDQTLKVEVSAGGKTKVLDFDPQENDPGHYIATFFPTVQTTYKYRVFGNITDNTPISLTWTCSPVSVSEDAVISNSTQKLTNGVLLKSIVGGFSCPEPRANKSFPETYPPFAEMNSKITNMQKEISSSSSQTSQSNVSNINSSKSVATK